MQCKYLVYDIDYKNFKSTREMNHFVKYQTPKEIIIHKTLTCELKFLNNKKFIYKAQI
jgi:hypothetical protein